LPLARRVQLAVVAHIRHVHTDYDNLLKSGSYLDARAKVEQACREQFVKWRGEQDSDEIEMEDIFREIIVIDDDEESNDNDDEDSLDLEHVEDDDREASVELISSQTAARDIPDNDEHDDIQWIHPSTSRRSQQSYVLRSRGVVPYPTSRSLNDASNLPDVHSVGSSLQMQGRGQMYYERSGGELSYWDSVRAQPLPHYPVTPQSAFHHPKPLYEELVSLRSVMLTFIRNVRFGERLLASSDQPVRRREVSDIELSMSCNAMTVHEQY
jgi:hypothetical protein